MTQGPNVRKLIATRASVLVGPPGPGRREFTTARLKALCDAVAEATAWVAEQLATVRAAPNNPYGDDEAIAGAILAKLAERRAGRPTVEGYALGTCPRCGGARQHTRLRGYECMNPRCR